MGKIWTVVFGIGFALGAVICYLFQAVVGASTRPDPNVSLKDWLTVILAGSALIVSLAALSFNRRKAKQDTFLSIHDKLIALDLQEGRRLLFEKINSPEDADRLLQEDIASYHKINRALAMYDVLGLYVKRRYVVKSWVLEEWGPGLAKARVPGKHFIAHRTKQGVPSSWKNFDSLSLDALTGSPKNKIQ
ncbi:hypothetical protein [Arthrobacter sp. FW306-2-2C-D06B]|uniref:hypothetical protein n=1 Tax=Arthrobacter sp. FW306-2-2C-D06B TaxID=2879618 RepID=UPI001F3DF0D0|nr:hypothetical protein [Arthrobacter sp. FW306-2-2C-D06B]UKA59141.1 hypothetical protein LFT47_01950 [Arthrobacter sp. FW306-2-2C-D06B]